jgi:hypothetical protein
MMANTIDAQAWDRLQAHMRRRWRLAHDAPLHMSLAWTIGEAHEQVEQLQIVELDRGRAGAQVRIVAEVASSLAISPLSALEHNATLAFGALALIDGTYVLRAMLPLADLTMPTLDRALELIAHEAARLRHLARPMAIVPMLHAVD